MRLLQPIVVLSVFGLGVSLLLFFSALSHANTGTPKPAGTFDFTPTDWVYLPIVARDFVPSAWPTSTIVPTSTPSPINTPTATATDTPTATPTSTPAPGATEYPIYTGYYPWGIAFDGSGNVWVAVPGCDPTPRCPVDWPAGRIEVFDPSSSIWIASYQLPAGYAQAFFLAFDSTGKLWFPLPMSDSIGMFDTTTRTFQRWTVPTAGLGPWAIAIDHSGYIWFTEYYGNKIGRFDPASQTFLEIATPALDSHPYGITVDDSNNIWFTENNDSVALIARYTANGSLLEYKVRNTFVYGLTPHSIVNDSNGNVWWTEGFVGKIGRLRVDQAIPGTNNGVTAYAYPNVCPACGEHASGIAVDANGLVWFDDSLQSIYGTFPDSGTGSFTVYNSPTEYSHPHDGLAVDGQNRIWFTEEYANRLAKAISP